MCQCTCQAMMLKVPMYNKLYQKMHRNLHEFNLDAPKMRKMRTSGTANNNSPYECITDVYLS